MRQDAFEQLCRDNPDVPRHDVLACTQKLLDRVLFCAFCEDRGLLPTRNDPQGLRAPRPVPPAPDLGQLPRAVPARSTGATPRLGIHAYNGGLFADDPVLDRLQVSDEVCGYFRELGEYDYRPAAPGRRATPAASSIDVDILGHIFEQSITDLETLAQRAGRAWPSRSSAEKHKTRRKKEGAFYTPSFITRYIIEQALGGVLRDRFEQLRQRTSKAAKGAAKTALADPRVYDLDKLKKPARAALVQFWEAWQDELADDPAARPGLRQRRLSDRSLRPVARRLPGVERSAGTSCAGIAPCSTSTSGFWKTTSTAWT